MTRIFLLKSHNEKPHICDRPCFLSNSISHDCLNLWAFLISNPNFFKLIASREDYGYFSDKPSLHEAFKEKKPQTLKIHKPYLLLSHLKIFK